MLLGAARSRWLFTLHALGDPADQRAPTSFDPARPAVLRQPPAAGVGRGGGPDRARAGAGGAGAVVHRGLTCGGPGRSDRGRPPILERRCPSSPPTVAASCPTSRASTCSATRAGKVIYVGKAKSIRKRVASHFSNPSTRAGREILAMIDQIEALVVHTEAEALLAEQNFIKQYKPRFNIRLRDDKSYPYIAISLDEDFPRVYFTRERHRRDRAYFGPYSATPSGSARRSRCWARCSCSAPARVPSRAGAAARRAWTTTSSAARRPASATSPRRSTAPAIDGVIAFLSGRYREIERTLEYAMRDGRRRAALRGRRARAQPAAGGALAARAPAGGQRGGGTLDAIAVAVGRRGGQRAGLPGPRRRALRPPELLPRQRGRGRHRRGRRGVHPPVLRERDDGPAAAGRPARARARPRRWPRR